MASVHVCGMLSVTGVAAGPERVSSGGLLRRQRESKDAASMQAYGGEGDGWWVQARAAVCVGAVTGNRQCE